ncbi:MAG: sigma-54-dependent Fis family transcriptional regulator [Planctomycetota bacterium]|nr:MAG: sigma-54-dependent Fis family transcriptional regulator [Planctomycetota bacterium]
MVPLRLLLDVWQEACRHIDIIEAVDRMAPLIARRLPVDMVLVRRLDLVRRRVETVATGICRAGAAVPFARTECSGEVMEEVLAWCRRGAVAEYRPDQEENALMAALVPQGLKAAVLAGPLVAEDGPSGVLLLATPYGRRLHLEDFEIVQALLEPFTVALENDRRLHELTRLREAKEADNRALLSRLQREDISDSVVGADGGLREVMERVEKVAPTDTPVLLLGETGSGKEVIARAIHARSRRAQGPIVRVNCGAIPPELVDSELFGHERGSFTGAVSTRQGWFERADGGTLFLDEIAELPLAAQVRLLRILQDGTFERVGGQRSITVDVRIVAATHRNLQDMVQNGRFRQDLWYRLDVFQVRIPPLRERRQDIPALAAHFAWRAGKRLAGAPLVPSPEDVERMVGYPWPGNVRELAAVIERAAILGDGRRLEVAAALGANNLGPAHLETRPAAAAPAPERQLNGGEIDTLDAAMARHIERALANCRGRIEGRYGAARLLGINPHTLRARMRKLGLDWKRFRAAD